MIGSLLNGGRSPIRFRFFTNHAHVLFLIARAKDVRMRELAAEVGITERAIQRIVEDLSSSGYLHVTKEGRRNRYEVLSELPMRHPVEAHRNVGDLIEFINPVMPVMQPGINAGIGPEMQLAMSGASLPAKHAGRHAKH